MDWQARVAQTVGRNVRMLREGRTPKMSAQALADATATLGHPIQRPVIANLENGRRASVTLTDMFVLARALNVPPFALIAPLTSEEPVEVLPGRFMSAWDAIGWFNGNSNYVSDAVTQQDEGFAEWYHVTDAYEMRWQYEVQQLLYWDAYRQAERAKGDLRAMRLDQLNAIERTLTEIRKQLAALGVSGIPPLVAPPDLESDT